MTPRQLELALRRQRLQWHTTSQRQELARHLHPFLPAFSAADRVGQGIAFLKQRPQWLAAAVVAFAVLRPRRAFRWARRGLVAWQVWRKLRSHLQQA